MKTSTYALMLLVAMSPSLLTTSAHANGQSSQPQQRTDARTVTGTRVLARPTSGWCPMRQVRKHFQGRVAFKCSSSARR